MVSCKAAKWKRKVSAPSVNRVLLYMCAYTHTYTDACMHPCFLGLFCTEFKDNFYHLKSIIILLSFLSDVASYYFFTLLVL
jgi:hypothetical protein